MPKPWIELDKAQARLAKFFLENKSEIQDFGSTVNQTFEAFVFASTVKWYRKHRWHVEIKNPQSNSRFVKLKFSTMGRPSLYTYAICTKGHQTIQIRHGLRVATKYHRTDLICPANVVLDIAVISDVDLSKHKTNDYIENSCLITFGEAKHMSAFAELVANFIGLVHELLPDRVSQIRLLDGYVANLAHPAPFMYVSGHLYRTAEGIAETIKDRGYDIDVYDYSTGGNMFDLQLPVKLSAKPGKSSQVITSAKMVHP